MDCPPAQTVVDAGVDDEDNAHQQQIIRNSISSNNTSTTVSSSVAETETETRQAVVAVVSSTTSDVIATAVEQYMPKAKPMERILVSPYEGDESAEIGEPSFGELLELITPVVRPLKIAEDGREVSSVEASGVVFGDKLASYIHSARRELALQQECYLTRWSSGKIRSEDCGWVPKKFLLLCLFGDKISNASLNTLQYIIRDLQCTKAVHAAMREWKLQDDYPELLSCKKFSYVSNKDNCMKCEIFVARAFYTAQVLSTVDNLELSLCAKIKDCLAIMNDNVRFNEKKVAKVKREIQRRKIKALKSSQGDSEGTSSSNQGPVKEISVSREGISTDEVSGSSEGSDTSGQDSTGRRSHMRLLNHEERLMTLRSLSNVVKEQYNRLGQTLALLLDSIEDHERLSEEEMKVAATEELRADISQIQEIQASNPRKRRRTT
jgi:hypothetical protein